MLKQFTGKIHGLYNSAGTPGAGSAQPTSMRATTVRSVTKSAPIVQDSHGQVTQAVRRRSTALSGSNASRPAMPGAWQSYRRASIDSLMKDASTPATPVSAARKGSATSFKSSTSTTSSRNNPRRNSLADKTYPELSIADGWTFWYLQTTPLKKDVFVRSVPPPPARNGSTAAPVCYRCGLPATKEIREAIPYRKEGCTSTFPGHYTAYAPARFECAGCFDRTARDCQMVAQRALQLLCHKDDADSE